MNQIMSTLISKYPLLWNTRFPIAFSILLLTNVLYFLFGMGMHGELVFNSNFYDIESLFFESGLLFLTIVFNLLFVILWLLFYLRNNAFKANYPISPLRLIQEFILVLVIIFLNLSLYPSFSLGVTTGYRQNTDIEQFNRDKEIIKYASPYLNESSYNYNPYSNNYQTYIVKDNSFNENEELEDYRSTPPLMTSYCCTDSVPSYYYFSEFPFIESFEEIQKLIDNNQKILETKNTKQIETYLSDYNKLCERIGYKESKVNINERIAQIFATPQFDFKEEYSRYYMNYDDNYDNYIPEEQFADIYITRLDELVKIDNDFFEYSSILTFISLIITLAIVSFRVTSIKEWLIAAVSLGILSILITIGLVLVNAHDNGAMIILLLFYTVFLSIGLFGKELKIKKLVYGTTINLALWTSPFVGIVIATFLDPTYELDLEEVIIITMVLGILLSSILLLLTPKYRAVGED